MKISQIKIHNYRSITNATIAAQGYLMLVGANNSGKSNVINALRAFYDELKWSNDDFPKKLKQRTKIHGLNLSSRIIR